MPMPVIHQSGRTVSVPSESDFSADLDSKANASQLGYQLIDAGTLSANTRKVIDNPFGIDVPVITQIEVYSDTLKQWGTPGWLYTKSSITGCGATCSAVPGVGIVIQTGINGLTGDSAQTGGSLDMGNDIDASGKVRIHVWKVTN